MENISIRSLDRVWVVIDEFGLDFDVEKHILYLLGNAEKDQVLVLCEMVLNDTVPNLYHTKFSTAQHFRQRAHAPPRTTPRTTTY